MKFRNRSSLLLAVGLLAVAPLVLAQATGEIRGQVKDSTGAVLPGVSVEVKSPALQGAKTAVTGPDGSYRISLLPPGEYTVTFSIAGFGPVRKNVAVQLDKTVVVEGTLSLSTTAEVTVSGAAPVIDATSSSTASIRPRSSTAAKVRRHRASLSRRSRSRSAAIKRSTATPRGAS